MLKIAVLASGSGTNAQSLAEHFTDSAWGRVEIIVTNNANAGVIERAERLNIRTIIFDPSTESNVVLKELDEKIDIVLLAGYLKNDTRILDAQISRPHVEYSSCTVAKIWRKGDVWKTCSPSC